MQKFVFWFLVIFAIPVLASASPDEQEVKEEAAKIVKTFASGLKKSLVTVVTKGGIAGAVGFCRSAAPEMAEEHSKNGFLVGRTSHKIRNSHNAPKKWMIPFLEKYKNSSNIEPKAPELVSLGEQKWGYVEPIYTTSLCLKCHGTKLDEDVKTAIMARYPEDQAHGFKRGDFRGMFWVEITK